MVHRPPTFEFHDDCIVVNRRPPKPGDSALKKHTHLGFETYIKNSYQLFDCQFGG